MPQSREARNTKRRLNRALNAEHYRAYEKIWRGTHAERHNARNIKWRKDSPDLFKQSLSQSRHRHRDRIRERARAYRASHPDYERSKKHSRRARKNASGGTWRAGDVAQLLIAQAGRCALCWTPLDANYHVDHIVPLVLGGSNWPSNLQLTHAVCNLRKGARC